MAILHGAAGSSSALTVSPQRPGFLEQPMEPIWAERVTKSGKTTQFDISADATMAFGFIHQDPVATPLGAGFVFGVSDGNLWFHVGADSGLSFWGSCRSPADFAKKGVHKVAPASLPRPYAGPMEISFRLKKLTLPDGGVMRIVMQRMNGACPLIGIANALILQGTIGDVAFRAGSEYVTVPELSEIIAGVMRARNPHDEGMPAPDGPLPIDPITGRPTLLSVMGSPLHRASEYKSYMAFVAQNVAILKAGLCVSPMFCSVDAFDYIPTCLVFPMLNMRVLHAWIVSPEDAYFGTLCVKSYDMLTDIQLAAAGGDAAATLGEDVAMVGDFLQRTALQVTDIGLSALLEAMNEDEVAVYFCNNHFSTITRHRGVVYRLVTDEGYVEHADIVWEQLTLLGDTGFYNTRFVERSQVSLIVAPVVVPNRGDVLMSVLQRYPNAEYPDLEKCYDHLLDAGTLYPTSDQVFLRWNDTFGMKGIELDIIPPLEPFTLDPTQPRPPPNSPTGRGGGLRSIGVVQGRPVLTSVQEDIVRELIIMGFPEDKARTAALTHNTLETALNSLI